MIEQNDKARDVLMDTVINKIDRQDEKSQLHDKRIATIENKLPDSLKLASDISAIKADIRSIAENAGQPKFPEGKMQELNKRLDNVLAILCNPSKSEVRHHHHFPIIFWATAGLFLVLCLVSAGWFITGQKMDQLQANGFKYRYLKVFADSTATTFLFRLDSSYEADPDSFKNVVVSRERLKQLRLELLDKIHSVDSQFDGGRDRAGEKKKP